MGGGQSTKQQPPTVVVEEEVEKERERPSKKKNVPVLPPAPALVIKVDVPKLRATSIESFEVMTTLGKGAFGRVRLARHTETSTLWAIKMLKKKDVLENKSISHLVREKNVLLNVRHPFIVNMPCAFHDSLLVYLVLEFVQGGPFDTRLRGEGSLSCYEAAFYTAQIVHVLEYLHSLGYIYRDLKPDNLLFDMAGYVKLTDFGFAKKTTFTKTLCGTPDYMAPEIIAQAGYGRAVDWWSLGIVLCEMLTGSTPFVSDSIQETYALITKNKPKWPSDLEGSGKACVKRFLAVKPGDRLGNGKAGVREVKSHRFYRSLDWEKLLRKELAAPHDPFVNYDEDTSNFDEYPDSIEPPSPPNLPENSSDPFQDFGDQVVLRAEPIRV